MHIKNKVSMVAAVSSNRIDKAHDLEAPHIDKAEAQA